MHSLFAHHGGRPLFYIRDRLGVAPSYLLTLLGNMQPLMEVLLKMGANANIMAPPNVVSPLYYLMRIICAMSPQLLGATREQVKRCVDIICRHGADPNVINAFGDNAMTLLLSSLSRWLYHGTDDPNRLEVLLTFTEDTLRLLLTHGLDPQTVLRKNLKQFVIIFNSTILDASFIRHLNQLFRHVIRTGGNPNLINLTELHCGGGGSGGITRKYTVSYYLARGLYIHARYHNQAAFEILDVFRNTLCQRHLSACMDGICASLDEEFEPGARSTEIHTRIKSIAECPRSLKQLCRIAVCGAVGWRLEADVRNLPLPAAICDYIYSLE